MKQILNADEVRVLGSLIEKELSTPDYYPLTINALTSACNQKSNRDPVVTYTDEVVTDVLEQLQRKRLVGVSSGAYSRATKYRHTLAEAEDLTPDALALLAELMLRGPQTVGELRGRSARMYTFNTLEEVENVLTALAERDEPLVVQLPRQQGQKEARYAHLLSGEPEVVDEPVPGPTPGFSNRLEQLEVEVTTLREQLEALQRTFENFRKQFE